MDIGLELSQKSKKTKKDFCQREINAVAAQCNSVLSLFSSSYVTDIYQEKEGFERGHFFLPREL